MNWNGQRGYLEHLIAKRSDPANAKKLQDGLDRFRRDRINSAINVRPVFLPLQIRMDPTGRTAPYRDTTQSLGFEVLITGIKADTRTRSIVLKRSADEQSFGYIGNETDLYLRADDIAGQAVTNGGSQLGTFYLPSPLLLPAGNRLTLEIIKPDTTGAAEYANFVFTGVRVGPYAAIDNIEQELIEQRIRSREIPKTIFLKQLINFDAAGVGGYARNKLTPRVDNEPLLIRGVRTTLRQSMIEVGIQGEPTWTVEPAPIWGVAGEDGLSHDNYQWFSKPVFLHSNNTIEVRTVRNGALDTVSVDAQTGNTITWICETV